LADTSIRRYEVFLPDAHLPATQPMYVLYHRLRSLSPLWRSNLCGSRL
jgi:hypothetical protein